MAKLPRDNNNNFADKKVGDNYADKEPADNILLINLLINKYINFTCKKVGDTNFADRESRDDNFADKEPTTTNFAYLKNQQILILNQLIKIIFQIQ